MSATLHLSCQGESHKATDKPCQDHSAVFTAERPALTIAVVADGHGGERYFRSREGAEIATRAAIEAVRDFVDNTSRTTLGRACPFTAVGPSAEMTEANETTEADFLFRALFASIIYRWREGINARAAAHALTEWEQAHVPREHLDRFEADRARLLKGGDDGADGVDDVDDVRMEKVYGCTLMAYVETDDCWFAFHIGDGKIFVFDLDGGNDVGRDGATDGELFCPKDTAAPLWRQPVPWDERCFLNKTTSLCDTDPLPEFRYCYEADGHFPTAVFLGSDGIDDTFGEDDNLANFYIQILKNLAREGREATLASLREDLPRLSRLGSRDDMTVACVYKSETLRRQAGRLVEHQMQRAQQKLQVAEEQAARHAHFIETHAQPADRKEQIALDYARKDLAKAREERARWEAKLSALADERTALAAAPTTDVPAAEQAPDNPAPAAEQTPDTPVPAEETQQEEHGKM